MTGGAAVIAAMRAARSLALSVTSTWGRRGNHRHKLMALEDASEKLISFFPNLQTAYNSELNWWQPEVPGPHIVYEDIFHPYVEQLLVSRETDALQRVFDFIEFLLTADDVRLHHLVMIAILTPLIVDPAQFSEARRYMGPVTANALRDVQNS